MFCWRMVHSTPLIHFMVISSFFSHFSAISISKSGRKWWVPGPWRLDHSSPPGAAARRNAGSPCGQKIAASISMAHHRCPSFDQIQSLHVTVKPMYIYTYVYMFLYIYMYMIHVTVYVYYICVCVIIYNLTHTHIYLYIYKYITTIHTNTYKIFSEI